MRLFKAGKISQSFYERSRSCGAQPARLYGLAKVHKKDVPLRPVLSLPGSCYENLTNELAKLFDQVVGAGLETSTEKVRNSIAAAELDRDEVMISLDVKSLYTNVPVDESIALAGELVETSVLDFSKETSVELMKLAVKDVCLQVGHN